MHSILSAFSHRLRSAEIAAVALVLVASAFATAAFADAGETIVTNPDLPGTEVTVPAGALPHNRALEIMPIAALPKSFPRFHTPVAGLVATTSRPMNEFNELLPVCFGKPDVGLGLLEEGQILELFAYDESDGSWGALGELIVADGQICSPEPEEGLPAEVGLFAEGIYVAGVRNLDLGCLAAELADGLGGATAIEPAGIFCNRFRERACKVKCTSFATTKGLSCVNQFRRCRGDCRDKSIALRPACFAVCSTEYGLCTAAVATENAACRLDCNCD